VPRIQYQAIRFGADRLTVIERANAIIAEYTARGFDLTLRQLFYQFVSRDLLANKPKEYKRLGVIVSEARMAGLIDWSAITDRTRNVQVPTSWGDPGEIVAACAQQFRLDKWADQAVRCEVWIEKDALVGVIEGVCTSLQVPYFSCRGYTSQSEMWAAGQRLLRHLNDDRRVVVFHLGDHDPSGIDMTRDVRDRLKLFCDADVEVQRLALNMDQVREYNPPPNPMKEGDCRSTGYSRLYGDESWELDALSPEVLADLIRAAVTNVRDDALWRAAEARERAARRHLQAVSDRWDELTAGLDD
jgi:hypothetical protein